MKVVATMLVLSAIATGLFAQSSARDMDNWHMAKYGRPSPATEAQLRDERANTAYREDAAASPTKWTEVYFQSKYGRNSPTEEARLKTERDNSAFREEIYQTEPAKTWPDHRFKVKYGRDRG